MCEEFLEAASLEEGDHQAAFFEEILRVELKESSIIAQLSSIDYASVILIYMLTM